MSQSILENEVNKIPIQDTDDYFSEQCRFKNLTDAGKRLADILKLLIDNLRFKFLHPHSSSPSSSSDYTKQEPPEEQRIIIYELLPVYDSESKEFVGKVEIPIEHKLIDTSS